MNFLNKFSKALKSKQLHQSVAFDISYFSKLDDRKIISISGKDAKSVLQGLQTNDMNIFNTKNTKAALYTQFLNPQGRIIYDAMIVRPQVVIQGQLQCKENEYWIDLDTKQGTEFMRHIKKYCLRKRVSINDFTNKVKVVAVYSDLVLPEKEKEGEYWNHVDQSIYEQTDEEIYTQVSYTDPRCSNLGMRFVIPQQDDLSLDKSISEQPQDMYEAQRLILGIPQGNEVVERLPFSVNLDFQNGVSFNKGCYVGQELTARTYHTGIVRRRVVPFILSDEPNNILTDNIVNPSAIKSFDGSISDSLEGESLLNKQNKEIGKILYNKGNIGIALVKYLEKGSSDEDLRFQTKNYKGQLIYSNWLNNKIDEYIKIIKEKEEKAAMF